VPAIGLALTSAIAGSPHARLANSSTRIFATSYHGTGVLDAVAATSASNAWAVGYSGNETRATLLLHWNGVKWSPVTTPKPVAGELGDISAVSATDAWAVGEQQVAGGGGRPLMLHWDGKTWARQSLPIDAGLSTVQAFKGGVWAAGGSAKGVPLLLHWTSGRWYVVPVELPKGRADDATGIIGMALTGNSSGWMISFECDLWRWNGAVWKLASLPTQGVTCYNLSGVAAGPRGTAWVVGDTSVTQPDGSLACATWFWDGKSWRIVPVLSPRNAEEVFGVGVLPNGTAWATGLDGTPDNFLMRWTGRAWQFAENMPVADNFALGIRPFAAASASDAWFVGGEAASSSQPFTIMILHWNGQTWQ
jgi:hypothetical protein